jgi:hypothetical protein
MKTKFVRVIPLIAALVAVSCALAPLLASAESERHRAHIHGVAELTVVLEGAHLEISFFSPSVNILGFEHKASSEKQLAAVDDAKAMLHDTPSLFSFNGAACELHSATIDVPSAQELSSDDASEHGEHKSHGNDVSHSDISAHYEYECLDGEQLQSLSIGGKALPFGLHKINVMWVSDETQGATVLTDDIQLIQLY